MTTPTPAVPLPQQIAELKRELALRRNVFPRQVAQGKMEQSQADHCTNAMVAALHTVLAVKRLRATLKEHWLTGVHCDHEAKTDTATCFCTVWRSAPQPNVPAAVDAWIDHVFERSRAAEEAGS